MNGVRYITTASGVRIGCAYQPKPRALSRAEERLQTALLDPRTAAPQSLLQRVLGALWRWL